MSCLRSKGALKARLFVARVVNHRRVRNRYPSRHDTLIAPTLTAIKHRREEVRQTASEACFSRPLAAGCGPLRLHSASRSGNCMPILTLPDTPHHTYYLIVRHGLSSPPDQTAQRQRASSDKVAAECCGIVSQARIGVLYDLTMAFGALSTDRRPVGHHHSFDLTSSSDASRGDTFRCRKTLATCLQTLCNPMQ